MNELFKKTLRGKEVDLYNLYLFLGLDTETTNIDDEGIEVIILYRVMIDARYYGIKDISITIEDIKVSGTITIDKASLSKHDLELIKKVYLYTEYSETIDINPEINIDNEWTITNELSIQKNNGVPENIEIELTAKRINVS